MLLAVGSVLPGLVPAFVLRATRRPALFCGRRLHSVHRAHVGDYVGWVLVGCAVLGGVLLV